MDVFFVLSKLLPELIYPLPLFFILTAAGFFLRKKLPRFGRFLRILAPLPLLFFSLPWVAEGLTKLWEEPLSQVSEYALEPNQEPPFDVIVVLGGFSLNRQSSADHLEMNANAERLLSALLLYKQGAATKLLITSGSASFDPADPSEAALAGAYALQWGLPPEDLILETQSRNTRENAALTQPILEAEGLKRVLLVTSAFHMKRSAALFRKLGIEVTSFSADTLKQDERWPFFLIPSPRALDVSTIVIKEMVGTLVYGLMGWL